MQRLLTFALAATLLFAMPVGFIDADDKADPQHTVKEVMKIAHKDGLLKSVAGGKASDEEKKQLLDLYVSLWENEAPAGDADSWKTKTGNVVAAAAKVVAGRDGAVDELKKSTNCGACHKAHKPK